MDKPKVQIFVCHDMEEGWIQSLVAQCDQDWEEHEQEMNVADAEEHQHREIEFCDMREDIDPYWEVNWREEADVELVPVELSPHRV